MSLIFGQVMSSCESWGDTTNAGGPDSHVKVRIPLPNNWSQVPNSNLLEYCSAIQEPQRVMGHDGSTGSGAAELTTCE